ncbi:hypothetical protein [Methylorubrum sp. SB2]|uniref:hypothetical protein n=1 Tax=Methylorubrum subtropicum TaxID=3138812 RepID=UPI00313E44CE
MTATRFLVALAAVLLATTVPVEAARQAQPAPEAPPFPQAGDRWFLSVRGPAAGGRAGFARIYADPVEGTDRWATMVTCGTVDLKTGREVIVLQATGVAGRSRRGDLGGTWTPVGGGETGGFGFETEKDLVAHVVMAAPCLTGRGDVSTGD